MLAAKLKSKRITQACDFCHRRGLKCKSVDENVQLNLSQPSCLTCLEYGQECTRKRQPKKRGTKPRGEKASISSTRVTSMTTTLTPPLPLGTGDSVLATVGGRESALAHRRVITLLLDVYLDSIHPKFPLFCERELWVGWREGSFPQDDSDFMSLMCLCALSAQHVGDGALFNDNVDAPERTNLREAYIAEATRLVPIDFDKSDLNLVRSFTFLALLGAQTGNNATLHKYLGLCHGISAHLSLQDESRWPAMLSPCEVEVRRRLWWSIYRLEVHTACVLGNIVRTSETRCAVGYPAGAHHPAFIPGRNGQFEDWFDGWNMTTDLYRVLEHAVSDLRAKQSPAHSILGRMGGSDPTALMTRLSEIQERLLPQFVTPASRSEDSGRNRCGFQAPSIICTIHLARLLSCMSSNGDPLLACQVATDLIASIMAIPLEYIRAAGSPLIQQLAGVGHILVGTAKKHQLLQEHYAQVKQVIHSITSLLDLLATPNTIASSTRDRLVNLVSELEDVYATTTANAKVNTVDEGHILHWLQDVEEPTLGQAAFPNELLTDFTWLYPAYP